MDYQNLYLFIKVLEKGSFIAAAESLGMPTSTLSRRIMALEQALGYRLLHRSPRKLSLTEAGEQYYRRCQPLYNELELASQGVDDDLSSPSGVLRVTAPVSLSNHRLRPWFFEFLRLYPSIQLELTLVNQPIDLAGEGIDVAFRIGAIQLTSWVSRPLFYSTYSLCAHPDTSGDLHALQHPDQLQQHPLIVTRRRREWSFRHSNGELYEFTPSPRLLVDDMDTALSAVIDGQGLGYLPDYLIEQPCDNGTLQPLMPDWRPAGREVHMLYPGRQYLPGKVRLFIEFMLAKFA